MDGSREDYIARKREEHRLAGNKRQRGSAGEEKQKEREFQKDRLLKISGLPAGGAEEGQKAEQGSGKDGGAAEGGAGGSTEAIDLMSAAAAGGSTAEGEKTSEGDDAAAGGKDERTKLEDETRPSRESIRAFLEMEGFSIRYIDFERGKEVAIVRLQDSDVSPNRLFFYDFFCFPFSTIHHTSDDTQDKHMSESNQIQFWTSRWEGTTPIIDSSSPVFVTHGGFPSPFPLVLVFGLRRVRNFFDLFRRFCGHFFPEDAWNDLEKR